MALLSLIFPVYPETIQLDRVTTCYFSLFGLCVYVNDFDRYIKFWGEISYLVRLRTYLSEVRNPSITDAQNLVFFSSGQQYPRGFANELTGQKEKYYDEFSGSKLRVEYSVSDASLLQRVLDSKALSAESTFVGVAFDAAFNWEFSKDAKNKIENAYFNWLLSKADTGNLKTVYLVGHSRGGVLVGRLAKRFTEKFKGTNVILTMLDPVANPLQLELGASRPVKKNPKNGAFQALTTDFTKELPNQKCLSVLNMLSGARVVGDVWPESTFDDDVTGFFVRGLGHKNYTSPLEISDGEPWYKETWVADEHSDIAQNSDRINDALNHFLTASKNITGRAGCNP